MKKYVSYMAIVVFTVICAFIVTTRKEMQVPMYGHLDPGIPVVRAGLQVPEPGILPESETVLRVVYTITTKQKNSCVSLTKRSPYPLSSKLCLELAKENKRKISNGSIVISPGEEWYLVEETTMGVKILRWKIPQGS